MRAAVVRSFDQLRRLRARLRPPRRARPFELHRRGLTRVERAERAERHLEDVNEAIAQVLDGTAESPRLVFRLEPVDVPAREAAAAAAGSLLRGGAA